MHFQLRNERLHCKLFSAIFFQEIEHLEMFLPITFTSNTLLKLYYFTSVISFYYFLLVLFLINENGKKGCVSKRSKSQFSHGSLEKLVSAGDQQLVSEVFVVDCWLLRRRRVRTNEQYDELPTRLRYNAGLQNRNITNFSILTGQADVLDHLLERNELYHRSIPIQTEKTSGSH